MKVVHFSDHHGQWDFLPEADLYVCTGDMLPNFMNLKFHQGNYSAPAWWRMNMHLFGDLTPRPEGRYAGRKTEPEVERQLQLQWCRERLGGFRRYLKSKDAPVVLVAGNHDFISYPEFFGGEVWEANTDPTRTFDVKGYKVGGFFGIPFIWGEWAGETRRAELDRMCWKLPEDIDFLITHAPPANHLDGADSAHYGVEGLTSYLQRRSLNGIPLKAHFFGHVHEFYGTKMLGDTLLSNAATTYLIHEFEDRK